MKRKFTLLLTTLLMLGAGSSWADDVTISSKSDWSTFAKAVTGGTTYSGQTVKLAADIEMTQSDVNFVADYMVGNSETNSFQGTFDGQGHTIKITKTGVSGSSDFAPFRYIKNATIKNLITTGALDISSEGQKKVAGIVSMVYGTSSIQNCSSSMKLSRTSDNGKTANGSDDATIGGIIAYVAADATVTVTNVLFDGEIVANKGISGIIGYVKEGSSGTTTCTISNTLFAGVLSYTTNSNIRNIYRAGSGSITVTASSNVYHKTSYNSTDKGEEATASNLLNGELAYTLASADNTGNTLFWGQGNLNKSNIEAYPSLTTDATKKVVKVKIKNMGTQPCVNPGGAVPNPCRFKYVGFKLNASDEYTLEAMPSESEFTYGTGDGASQLENNTTGMYCITMPAAATTLVLPFNASLPEGITAYKITYSSGEEVTATSVSSITANEPVLINGTVGQRYKFTNSGDSFDGTYTGTAGDDHTKTNDNGALTGVYVHVNEDGVSGYNPLYYVPKDSYVLQKQGDNLGFYKVAAENTIKITSFRAYLTASTQARLLSINFEDENTTAISSVERNNKEDDAIYTLTGIKVEHPTSGIYIKNGKKYYVK